MQTIMLRILSMAAFGLCMYQVFQTVKESKSDVLSLIGWGTAGISSLGYFLSITGWNSNGLVNALVVIATLISSISLVVSVIRGHK